MLLVGVHLNATRVLLDQDFSHLKKHYRMLSIHRYSPMSQPAGIEDDLARIYSDKRYTDRKRLFSQDGRPSKMVRSRPKLIVHSPRGCTAIVEALRRRRIPVEGIFLDEDQGWRQDDVGKGLGYNYHVSTDAIEVVLSRVIAEQRLTCEESVNPTTGAGPSAEKIVPGPSDGEDAFRQALAAAVWFRETIRYNRSYRA